MHRNQPSSDPRSEIRFPSIPPLHRDICTVNLTRTQAKTCQRAINNHRKLEKTTQEMRELSLKILETTTSAVKRRKSTK